MSNIKNQARDALVSKASVLRNGKTLDITLHFKTLAGRSFVVIPKVLSQDVEMITSLAVEKARNDQGKAS